MLSLYGNKLAIIFIPKWSNANCKKEFCISFYIKLKLITACSSACNQACFDQHCLVGFFSPFFFRVGGWFWIIYLVQHLSLSFYHKLINEPVNDSNMGVLVLMHKPVQYAIHQFLFRKTLGLTLRSWDLTASVYEISGM